jgi:hypothetical protein
LLYLNTLQYLTPTLQPGKVLPGGLPGFTLQYLTLGLAGLAGQGIVKH